MPKRKPRTRGKTSKSRGRVRRGAKTLKAARGKRAKPSPRRRAQPKPVGATFAGGWSVALDWVPAGVRVVINFIGANGHQVAQDEVRERSPASLPLPRPEADGRYTFTWSISPDQHLDGIRLWAVDETTGSRSLIDQSGPQEPADVWSQFTGKTIHSPVK